VLFFVAVTREHGGWGAGLCASTFCRFQNQEQQFCTRSRTPHRRANGVFLALTNNGGNATATNTGIVGGGIQAETLGGGDATATNSGTNNASLIVMTLGGGNATATNTGNTAGISAETNNGGNATATNTGTNNVGEIAAETNGGSNATANNSGSNAAGIAVETLVGGDAIVNNSGGNPSGIQVLSTGGNAIVTNSGSNGGGISALATGNVIVTNSGSNTLGITVLGTSVTVSNSGNNSVGIDAVSTGGNTVANNSGSSDGGIFVEAQGGGNAVVNNSGAATGTVEVLAIGGGGTESVTNSGIINGLGGAAIEFSSVGAPTNATLTNIVGGRVIGAIDFLGTATDTINFQGGNWLFIFNALSGAIINTNGAPFVVSGNTIAVLDPTSFALADRALTNFTGEVHQMLQGRFDGMVAGGGGSSAALGFAGAPSTPGIADQATQAFSGIPSVAMSYASDSRPLLGKAPAAAAPHYDTTIWASGFGGERKQNADGVVLPATDIVYGGALGIDRAFGPICASGRLPAAAPAEKMSNFPCRASIRPTRSAAVTAASICERQRSNPALRFLSFIPADAGMSGNTKCRHNDPYRPLARNCRSTAAVGQQSTLSPLCF
jgi:hypothetical protein